MTLAGTYRQPQDPIDTGFELLYTRLRQKEGRFYRDEEVMLLPLINVNHPHYKEWVIRKHSCKALLSYINQKNNIVNILEVGCGNGWLCAQLAKAVDAEVTGVDINTRELEQAKRVFFKIADLEFIQGGLESDILKDKKFDMIIFAASIQYFPSLKHIIGLAIEHLTLLGEIHIIDSPFYQHQEIEAARQRTKKYYSSMGFEGLAGYYFHHTLTELETFQYKILHHPFSWKNKLSIKKNPFYWISIKNRYR
ncbi:MAG TPA: class I SAM-dependent methyltransferase [Ferruginibacter sp.]|nr:class I SAM-dependent methyltransferase [Ferruginibacter sp.]